MPDRPRTPRTLSEAAGAAVCDGSRAVAPARRDLGPPRPIGFSGAIGGFNLFIQFDASNAEPGLVVLAESVE